MSPHSQAWAENPWRTTNALSLAVVISGEQNPGATITGSPFPRTASFGNGGGATIAIPSPLPSRNHVDTETGEPRGGQRTKASRRAARNNVPCSEYSGYNSILYRTFVSREIVFGSASTLQLLSTSYLKTLVPTVHRSGDDDAGGHAMGRWPGHKVHFYRVYQEEVAEKSKIFIRKELRAREIVSSSRGAYVQIDNWKRRLHPKEDLANFVLNQRNSKYGVVMLGKAREFDPNKDEPLDFIVEWEMPM